MDQQVGRISACSKCPGFCCKLFLIGMSPEEMVSAKKEQERKIRELANHMLKRDYIPKHKVRELAEAARLLEMLNFGIDHFYRVLDVVDEESDKDIGDGSGFPRKYTYTCDQWNQETGRCNCHTTRPWVCESFICGPAAEGRVPTRKDFPYSAQITDEDAKRILETRNNGTPELCKAVEVLSDTSP